MSKNNGSNNLKLVKVGVFLFYFNILLISIIGMAVNYQALTGKRDIRTALEINLALAITLNLIGFIMKFILKDINKTMAMHLLTRSRVVVPRGEFIDLSVKADTNLYDKDITPTNPLPKKECVFIVEIEIGEFPQAPVLMLSSMYNSKAEMHQLNNGMEFSKNGYMYNIVARSGESINFRFNLSGIVKKFSVMEYYIP